MSRPSSPKDTILFFGVLFNSDYKIDKFLSISKQKYGNYFYKEINYFPMAQYYSSEMGEQDKLSRAFMIFTTPYKREELIETKLWANELELKFSKNNNRLINIDPGYISLENCILSTCKSYSHRVYLGDGVYSELVYQYINSQMEPLDWTYPDYLEDEVKNLFKWSRNLIL
mgnify:CR=1 FL=1